MVETQTHTQHIDTILPQTVAETAPVIVEPLDETALENWRDALTETGAYIKESPQYFDLALKAKTDKNPDELLRLRSDFVHAVELPILEFTRAYVSSTEQPQFTEVVKALVGLLPDIPQKSRNTLLVGAIDRANTIIRIENYCHQHAIDVSTPTDSLAIARGVDMLIDGDPIYVGRYNKKPFYPDIAATSAYSHPITQKYSLRDPASDSHMTRLLDNIAATHTKKVPKKTQPIKKKAPKSNPVEKNVIDKISRIAPVIASKAVGLSLNENEPPYARKEDMLTTTPEALVTQILDDALDDDEAVDFYKIDSAEFGRRVAASIMRHHDSDLIVALKRFTAQTHGVRLVTETNGIAKELVAAAEGRLSQAGLRDALTYLYEFGHKTEATQSSQIDGTLGEINGRRVEVSTHYLLSEMGYHVQEASRTQDNMGVDLFIDGVPFDIKSTKLKAHQSAKKELSFSQQRAYYPSVRFVPPFTRESFEGQIIVPDHVIEQLAKDQSLRMKIDAAIADYRAQFGSHVNFDEASRAPDKAYRPTHLDSA